ncbi:MAG: glycosyltransferase [Rhodoferax sp.]|nr:glycosyltransferase [Rhodoferax sp.]
MKFYPYPISLLQTSQFAWFLAFALTLMVALVIVKTQALHGHWSSDPVDGVQKFHTQPTPRVGGVAIVFGVAVAFCFAPSTQRSLLWPLLIAGIPACLFGLMEDVTKRIGVRTRLVATMFSGVLAWVITGIALTRGNMPGLDWMLGHSVVSVAFTAFAVGGIANAINIIDGFNGLAAGTVIIILSGFAVLCLSVGDSNLAYICILFACAMVGFLLINWPMGKLFLGDGGAYFMGFAVAWIAVLMLARHPEISAWAPLLVCSYPILEVLFSMLRRQKRGIDLGTADRLHLHSLVKKRLVRRLIPKASKLARNSVTGCIMWSASVLPAMVACWLSADSLQLFFAFVLFGLLYSSVYARLTQFRWCFKPATVKVKPYNDLPVM